MKKELKLSCENENV